MEVCVDGVLIDDTFLDSETTLEGVLKHVQSSLCGQGQLVVGVQCDGQNVPADEMTDTLRKPAASFDRIEVFTGTRASLVADAMDEASTCLTETNEACRRVATKLTEGETVAATETLGDCLRVWQQIHEAVAKSIEMLGIDPADKMLDGESLQTLIGKPKNVLLQIRSALQARDYVLLADILEYEFSEVTNAWHSMVALLRQEAEQPARTPQT